MPHPAYLVHLYTASGAVCGLLALLAAVDARVHEALLWLVLATVIDATDGWLARLAHVDRHATRINGARMDDIVDYLTYVVVPAVLLLRTGALPPGGWGLAAACATLLSSVLGFSRQDAKTDDHFFTGFPSYWNIVALYILVARMPPAANAALLLVLSVLVFVPIRYVYPSRTVMWRPFTIAFCSAWGVQVLGMIGSWPDTPAWLFWSSLAFPLYYTGLSFWLTARRTGRDTEHRTERRTGSRPSTGG